MSHDLIHDRGRGSEVVGTRITVYNLLPYFLDGTVTEGSIAALYNLTPEQVSAQRAHALNNAEAVLKRHAEIEARMSAGNPPEVVEKLKRGHGRFLQFKKYAALRAEAEARDGEARDGEARDGEARDGEAAIRAENFSDLPRVAGPAIRGAAVTCKGCSRSLQATLAAFWSPGKLPILTLANKRRFERDADYRRRVAEDVADLLLNILAGDFRDCDRIYVPR